MKIEAQVAYLETITAVDFGSADFMHTDDSSESPRRSALKYSAGRRASPPDLQLFILNTARLSSPASGAASNSMTYTPLLDKINCGFVEDAVLREDSAKVVTHDLGGLFQVLADGAVALLELHRGDWLRVRSATG